MAESMRTIPHAHTVYKVDMTRIVRLRDRERAAFEQRHGVKLTYMPFIAVAAVEALRSFPSSTLHWIENSIHYHGNIHLGHRRRFGVGPDRARDSRIGKPRLRLHRPLHSGPCRPRTHQETSARRSGRIHLHAHQCRRLRRRIRHAHHQSSPSPPFSRSAACAKSPSCSPTPTATTPSPFAPCSTSAWPRSPPHRRRRRRQVHDGVQAHPRKLGSPHRLTPPGASAFRYTPEDASLPFAAAAKS